MTNPTPLSPEDRALLAALADGPALRGLARTFGITKSTLSRRVLALEEQLGQELFLRRGRALQLTLFGQQLTERARAAQQSLEALDLAAQSSSDDRVVVALSPLFAELGLAPVLERFAVQRPGVRVDVRISHDYSNLFDERIDVALRRGPLRDSTSLKGRKLGSLTMVCVATPRLAQTVTALPLEERVRALPWIRVGVGLEPFAVPLLVNGRRRELTVMPRYAVDSQRLALLVAQGGLGVARVNAFAARAALEGDALVEVLPEARQTDSAWVVSPATRHARPVIRDFVGCLVDVTSRLTIWDS
jgi:DNA-binding transcriptional LysR family regulator